MDGCEFWPLQQFSIDNVLSKQHTTSGEKRSSIAILGPPSQSKGLRVSSFVALRGE